MHHPVHRQNGLQSHCQDAGDDEKEDQGEGALKSGQRGLQAEDGQRVDAEAEDGEQAEEEAAGEDLPVEGEHVVHQLVVPPEEGGGAAQKDGQLKFGLVGKKFHLQFFFCFFLSVLDISEQHCSAAAAAPAGGDWSPVVGHIALQGTG